MGRLKTTAVYAVAASICAGCAGAHHGASISVGQGRCRTLIAMPAEPSVDPSTHAPSPGDDAESRVRKVAENDLRCSAQQVYVRRVFGVGDVEEGGTFEFYGAERCGLYQVYRASQKHGVVEAEGVDVFLVSPASPGALRMTSLPSYRAHAPSHGEAVLLLGERGVVCQGSVGNEVSRNVWALEGCPAEPPIPLGVVAVRASEATKAARLELHWIKEPRRAKSANPVALWSSDDNESTWRPFTIVDLSGDRRRQVAVFCRRPGTSEYECERFMVYRNNKEQAGWFVPVARARWTPDNTE